MQWIIVVSIELPRIFARSTYSQMDDCFYRCSAALWIVLVCFDFPFPFGQKSETLVDK